MSRVYLALGSNLGDRDKNILLSLAKMEQMGIKILQVSSVLETKPYGVLEQPGFLNAVCFVETLLAPLELLAVLKKVEQKMGRQEGVHWGPRIIDLDILFYDEMVFARTGLQIPHADMLNRLFVLEPLAEIAPDFVHPVSKKTVMEHYLSLKDGSEQEKV